MEKRELKLDYWVYTKTYPVEYREICEKAVEATGRSYSIYSGFSVGAVVLLDSGEVFTGANQENVAYPSGLCAERTVLFYVGANRPDVAIKAMAIAACYRGELTADYISPCGACRQVMAEVIKRYGKDFDVILIGNQETILLKASALLPFAFDF